MGLGHYAGYGGIGIGFRGEVTMGNRRPTRQRDYTYAASYTKKQNRRKHGGNRLVV